MKYLVRLAFPCLLLASGFLLPSLAQIEPQDSAGSPPYDTSNPPPAFPRSLEAAGLRNFFQLTPRLYSGSAPVGDDGFESLRRMGVRTILSVDGSKPDVEMAHRHGLRYIHIPIGYDGATHSNLVSLVRAAEVVDGPLYVHCHHGKHRGPTAAALICEATAGWTTNKGLAWLEEAGTSPDYPGLFKNVAEFRGPPQAELDRLPARFPEQVEISRFVDAMVAIDGFADHLKAVRQAGFRPPPNHPDLDPPHEAMMLAEAFRELLRRDDVQKRGENFVSKMQAAEASATALHGMLQKAPFKPDSPAETSAIQNWTHLTEACANCHKKYRN